MSEVIIDSHVGEVKAELAHRIPTILEALGIEAEGNAVTEITELGAVDTGRLRGSITHATDQDSAYIGTDVEYAQYVELGTYKMAARPFLRNAITKYTDDYKRIIQSGLE
jgi:HK97 gp10 family phage protein